MSELPQTPAELAAHLRRAADQLLSGRALPVPPATMTAQQITALLDDIAERRTQVQALRDGLGVFDEQLAGLETAMGPLLAWSQAWSGVESAWTQAWRPPGG